MKETLTLHEEGHAGSFVVGYRVELGGVVVARTVNFGSPANIGSPDENHWRILRIKDGVQGKWMGDCESPEAALAVLRQE